MIGINGLHAFKLARLYVLIPVSSYALHGAIMRIRTRYFTLTLAILFASLLLYWVAQHYGPRKSEAIMTLRDAGYSISYDVEVTPFYALLEWIGIESGRLTNMVIVADNITIDQGHLAEMSKLGAILSLDLNNCLFDLSVTGAGAPPQIERLVLRDMEYPQVLFRTLLGTNGVRSLMLVNTVGTDSAIATLSEEVAAGIETFVLHATDATGNGWDLSTFHAATHIDLQASPITDQIFQVDTSLIRVRWLNISGTAITDTGISALVTLPELKWLTMNKLALSANSVLACGTIEGLNHLVAQGVLDDDEAKAMAGLLRRLNPDLEFEVGEE